VVSRNEGYDRHPSSLGFYIGVDPIMWVWTTWIPIRSICRGGSTRTEVARRKRRNQMPALHKNDIGDLMGVFGLLAKYWPGYKWCPGSIGMALCSQHGLVWLGWYCNTPVLMIAFGMCIS